MPTGSANSPIHFTNALNKILNYKVCKDKNGKVIYTSPNVVKLEKDPLLMSSNYCDDVITTSYTKQTYELTLDSHFDLLELAVERLAFHGAKINFFLYIFLAPGGGSPLYPEIYSITQ